MSIAHDKIAIVGMACRFPEANHYEDFWRNLENGKNCIREIPASRWNPDIYSTDIRRPEASISKWCGLLDDIDRFDAAYFGISSRESKSMDPQQRLLLQETLRCIEDSAISPNTLRAGKTGVFMGVMAMDYLIESVARGATTDSYACLGNYSCMLANRLSYYFDFQGPSFSLDAACGSSLVALHQAKLALLSGEADYALAGGVSLDIHPWKYIAFSKSRMLSPDGQCKTFDADANGYVPGEGAGVVLLRRLEDAVRDRNHIYGVLLGSAVRHVGHTLSVTAPSIRSQEELVAQVLQESGVHPDTVSYIEAHGTGTSLGDPIEVAALTRAFSRDGNRRAPCRIGSAKSNIGHLEAAAGIVGIVKVLLMMRHRKIPPTLNVVKPNPLLFLADSPFKLALQTEEWLPEREGAPLRAGVSSFGFGGAIAHAILESPPPMQALERPRGVYPFLLSAKTETSLRASIRTWQAFARNKDFPDAEPPDICASLATGREHRAYRWSCSIRDREDLIAHLDAADSVSSPAERPWLLEIGDIRRQEFGAVKPYFRKASLIRDRWKDLQRSITATPGLSEALPKLRAAWPETSQTACTFLADYIYLSSLMNLGFAPATITGSGSGIWQALALSGMVAPSAVLATLLGKLSPAEIRLSLPKIPFYDPVGGQRIAPVRFEARYFLDTFQNADLSGQHWSAYLEDARNLEKSQYTFKNFLNEWTPALLAKDLSRERLLSAEPLSRSAEILRILVIESSLAKLYRKWQLSPKTGIADPGLQELSRLLAETDPDKSVIVELAFGDTQGLAGMLQDLNRASVDRLTPQDFPLLRRYAVLPETLADFPVWLSQALNVPGKPPAWDGFHRLQFGADSGTEATVRLDKPTALLDACLYLWRAGANIDWKKYFGGMEFYKTPLPVYEFDGERYWMDTTRDTPEIPPDTARPEIRQDAPVSESETPRSPPRLIRDPERPGRFVRTLSPQDDAIVRDTVVEGQCITPSPLRLALALQAGKVGLHPATNRLCDIHFPNPGIIDRTLALVVELGNDGAFSLAKCGDDSEIGEVLAKGRLERREAPELPRHARDNIPARELARAAELYELFESWGYRYGPGMRLIDRIEETDDAFLIHIGTRPTDEAQGSDLDPFILDCMFQGVFYVGHLIGDFLREGYLYVPIGIKSLTLLDALTRDCYAVIGKSDVHATEDGDLRLSFEAYDTEGKPLLAVDTIYFRRVRRDFLSPSTRSPAMPHTESQPARHDTALLLPKTLRYLQQTFAEALGQTRPDIDENARFQSIGVDSLINQDIVEKLGKTFAELPSTVLFEYSTLKRLTAYFAKHYEAKLCEVLNLPPAAHAESALPATFEKSETGETARRRDMADAQSGPADARQTPDDLLAEPIAIVGCSGRFPQSPSVEALWENLKQGKNCIVEVPPERWDYREHYDETRRKGKSYTRFGGFLEGHDEFDPLFFNIAPKQAQLMDPQQRIFLEAAWSSIEDAGYTRQTLPKNTGVFVGATTNTYALWAAEHSAAGQPQCPDTDLYDIANRVSYFCDFHGPSMTVDTACSSSLSCVHLAVQSLRQKECELAIAGGVSLTLHPHRVVQFCQKEMLSGENRCHPFGEGKGGFVDAEGVAAIVLKPLSQALKDRDPIYAVIRGTSINSGGRTGGYTVPSPRAQAELVAGAIERAGVPARSIGYVETHGTGTILGDPIEIEGLTQAFRRQTEDTQFCAIGSVKSNIGHLIAAAGISGLIKVVLQLRHRTLVPSLHSTPANPRIPFAKTPFYVQRELAEWKGEYPRRAGVSSFGVGGSNAHAILEEYRPAYAETATAQTGPCLVPLSAKNRDRLLAYARKLLEFLKSHAGEIGLPDLAYTLQIGREAMEERLVLLVSSADALVSALERTLAGQAADGIESFQGNAETAKKSGTLPLLDGEAGATYLNILLERKNLGALAQLWAQGAEVDWHGLYPQGDRAALPHRISLPTYPYARQRCWLPQEETAAVPAAGQSPDTAGLHPLLDRVDATRSFALEQGMAFRTTLAQSHWTLQDHRIDDRPVLPGVAYLEMAWAAAAQIEAAPLKIVDAVWLEALSPTETQAEIEISLLRRDGKLAFEAHGAAGVRHAQAYFAPLDASPAPLPWQDIQARCPETVDPETLYARFRRLGIAYGPTFRGIAEWRANGQEAIAVLRLPDNLAMDFKRYRSHPALMDAALQTALALLESGTTPPLPFMVEEVAVYRPPTPKMLAYAKKTDARRADVYLSDETGQICATFKNMVFQAAKDPLAEFFYAPQWIEEPVPADAAPAKAGGQTILVFMPPEDEAQAAWRIVEALRQAHPESSVLTLRETNFDTQAFGAIHAIYFLAGLLARPPELEAFEAVQDLAVHALHRIVRALARSRHAERPLRLTALTAQIHEVAAGVPVYPWVAGLAGLTKTLIKEYPHWQIRRLSLNPAEILRGTILPASVFAEPRHVGTEETAWHRGRRYVRRFSPISLPPASPTPLRQRGVYLIAGGLGGVGRQLGEYLAEKVQARLVLLGRSPLDADRRAAIDEMERKGAEALYVPADLRSWSSAQAAIDTAIARFGEIHGIFASAIVLQDQALENMSDEAFRAAYDTKAGASVHLCEAAVGQNLDFIVFFSSILAVVGNPGQGNYVAGGTFQDAYAHYLRQNRSYPVQVIDWGYWGTVGIVASEDYRRRMGNRGMNSIRPEEGMEAIARILAHRDAQIVAVKADRGLLDKMQVVAPPPADAHASLLRRLADRLDPPELAKPELSNFHGGYKALRAFAHGQLYASFRELGLLESPGNLPARHLRFYRAARRILEQAGAAARSTPGQAEDLLKKYPEIRAHLELLTHCIAHYPAIFREEILPTQAMFPGSSMEKVEGVYKGNPVSDYFNALAAHGALAYIEERRKTLSPGQKLRIVEIGAGTGGTSASVLRAISAHAERLEYVYTDVSNFFLAHGRKQFGETYPFVSFQLLDIAKDLVSQKFRPGSFDLVLATNVLHATPQIRTTVDHVQALLKDGGWLILNEMTQAQDVLTLTFGLLDGWWLYEDGDLRIQDSPLLAPQTWQTLLGAAGLRRFELLGAASGLELAQNVMVAEKSGAAETVAAPKAFGASEEKRPQTLAAAIAPASFARLETLPTGHAPQRPAVAQLSTTTDAQAQEELEQKLLNRVLEAVAAASGIEEQDIDEEKPFSEYGIDSITGIELIAELNRQLDISLSKTALFDYATVAAMAAHIAETYGDAPGLGQTASAAAGESDASAQLRTVSAAFASALGPHCQHWGSNPQGDRHAGETASLHLHIAVEENNCIRDHVIYGQYIMPSDAYLEILYIGARRLFGYSGGLQVENFDIKFPMITFPGIPLDCRLQLTPDARGDRFAIQSRKAGQGEAYKVSVDGRFRELAQAPGHSQDFADIFQNPEIEVDPGQIYTPDAILKVGPSYRTIQTIHIRGDSAVSRLRRTPEGEELRGRFVLEPSIVDGLFATGLYFASHLSGNPKNFFIPVLFDRILVFRELHEDEYYGVVKTVSVKDEHIVFNLSLVDGSGQEAMVFQGFHLQKILAEDLKKNAQAETVATPARSLPAASGTGMDIAIVGMAGRFPQAENVGEYWQNLAQGRNCVTEVPADRWSLAEHFDPDPGKRDKTYSKWGGFLKDIDRFDSLFFQISGKEGELSDPQQRIFLEDCWHALEDAGYSDTALSGVKLGVFAGCTKGDYQLKMHHEEGAAIEGFSFPGNEPSVMAARISYFLNLKGPSIAVNTACSSSLVAINLACQSLLTGESEMALAGGIHICTTPLFYKLTSKSGMLSPTGQCRAFDNDANGFVPGEASAAIVLKPLDKALADGDPIYGTIRGIGVNQDGKTNGMTAPSSVSQTELEVSVYRRHGIPADSINYIETHGTGTKLGDPIEVEALTKAFRTYTQAKRFCPIGSVKTNIGHTAYAAGVSSVVKVLLAMKHRQIPPSLHCRQLNEYIDFENGPFYVNRELRDWTVPAGGVRRAAVSSFGISGTNCHLVIDEPPPLPKTEERELPLYPIPLSAKTPDAFAQKCRDLLAWLQEEDGRSASLGDIAHTLQAGRSHFAYRAACTARDKRELIDWLASAPEPKRETPSRDTKKQGQQLLERLRRTDAADPDYPALIRQLAALYEQGHTPDWRGLASGRNRRRLSMPGYPFERERFWIPDTAAAVPTPKTGGAALHPLLDRIHPGLSLTQGLTYEKIFRPSDWPLRSHRVAGKPVLPGAAYLEMARAAFAAATDRPFRLTRIVWAQPLIVETPETVVLSVSRAQGQYRFVVQSGDGTLHGNGEYSQEPPSDAPSLADKIENLRGMGLTRLTGEALYALLQSIGVAHAGAMRCVQALHLGEREALAELAFDPAESDADRSVALLDGCLQLGAAFVLHPAEGQYKSLLPYSAEAVEFLAPLPSRAYVYLEKLDAARFDLSLTNEQGQVCVRLREAFFQGRKESSGDFFYVPRWDARALAPDSLPQRSGQTLWFVGSNHPTALELQRNLERAHAGDTAWEIRLGERSEFLGERRRQIDARRPHALADCLQSGELPPPDLIYFLGGIQDAPDALLPEEGLNASLQVGALSLLRLIKALIGGERIRWPLQLRVLTESAQPADPQAPVNPYAASLFGLAKTAAKEYPQLHIRCLDFRRADAIDEVAAQIRAEPDDALREVAFRQGKRYVPSLEIVDLPPARHTVFRQRGVYLILGGAGGIGFAFSRYLAETVKARLVWIGRSAPDAQLREKLDDIAARGGEALYLQADAGDANALRQAVASAKSRFGRIHGAVHSAIVLRDKSLANMDEDTFLAALMPKTLGSVNLYKALADETLDFLLFFSSGESFTCYAGQSNYAAACTFKDAFARYLEQKLPYPVKILNWGYWGTVGVVASPAYREQLAARGVHSIEPETGMDAIERVMASPLVQVAPMKIGRAHLREIGVELHGQPWPTAAEAASEAANAREEMQTDGGFMEKVEDFVATVFAEALRLKKASVDPQASFDAYGMDSLIAASVLQAFEARLGKLPVVTLYQHNTVASLAAYFAEHRRAELEALPGLRPSAPALPAVEPAPPPAQPQHVAAGQDQDIAIVGLSGRYPMAEDLDEFWENLKQGKNCIREVPPERWNWRDYYSDDKNEAGAIYSKWGGFIDDADKFDPLFFAIPPNEAKLMDPQERLFVESAWTALEDAGYARQALAGRPVGVFVGLMHADYESLAGGQWSAGNPQTAHSSFWSVANRISYLLDLNGPSLAVDTACSSSLTALHLAYHSLLRGECELAIAGGVNLILHPKHYLRLAAATMMSQGDRCKSFGAGADGLVAGEGAGAAVLKPLAKALADGDRIYGVLKASTMNAGGKTGGYTVPNPNAQRQAIAQALRQAAIDPATVGYIEAHGTGTSIGDPIEIAALTQAYRELGVEGRRRCAIGSVKSNVGHLESAAGLAGLSKVLLQLRHGLLTPSLHAETPNPHIDFDDTPFYVQQTLAEWRPADAGGKPAPRRAGLSSFGAGGTNHHVVVEEAPQPSDAGVSQTSGPWAFALSAKTEERLLAYARRYARFLRSRPVDPERMAYTMQTGREAMAERLAIVFRSQDELLATLERWIEAQTRGSASAESSVFRGRAQMGERSVSAPENTPSALAGAWVTGATVDWRKLYPAAPRRIGLPTYPFLRERYWIETAGDTAAPAASSKATASAPRETVGRGLSVAVIGAGPAGLAAAKCLLEDGHNPEIFEKTDRIGGIWCFRDGGRGGPYRSTRLQTSKFTSLFSDFPPPESMSIFPGVEELNRYLNAYADRFGLRERIRTHTALDNLRPENGRWRLALRGPDGGTQERGFDAVCICVGNFWKPKKLACPGLENFRGEYLHSADYHSPEIFRGKRVLIVGNGVSGMDISVEAAQEAKQVFMSLRSKKMIIPRMFGFTTNDGSISPIKRSIVDRQRIADILREWRGSIPRHMEDMEKAGLMPDFPVKDSILLVSCDYPRAVAEGKIALVPETRAFDAHGCELENGERAEIDTIVDCTGYEEADFPFLPPGFETDALYKHQFHPDYPTLCIVGRKHASLSVIPTMELEARWFSKILSGACRLPDPAAMRAAMAEDRRKESRCGQLFPSIDSARQNMWLAEQIGAFPNPVREWKLYWELVNLPAIPAIYRLTGPDRWPEAERYVAQLKQKLFINLNDPRIEATKYELLARLGRANLDIMVELGQISPEERARALGEAGSGPASLASPRNTLLEAVA